MKVWILVLTSLLAFGQVASAEIRSIEGVSFPDKVTENGQDYVLNGVGLRTKKRFAMNFKVYVAGLYTKVKSAEAKALIESAEPKILGLVFLRSLDKKTLTDAWTEGFEKNCKFDCDKSKEQLKAFNDLMVDVKEKHRMRLFLEKDSVTVELKGTSDKSGKISGEAFRKNLLAIFIGDHPPTAELKAGLLGKH